MNSSSGETKEASVSGTTLRAAMRWVPAPVTVVTARAGAEEQPFGITIGSFASVSLDPPLVSFNVSEEARTYGWLAGAERFAVHMLRRDQAALAERFADPGLSPADQFAGLAWHSGPGRRPVLDGTRAVLHCCLHSRIRAGDSDLVVGHVVGVERAAGSEPDALGAAGPLLYYRRGYRTMASGGPQPDGEEDAEAENRSASRTPETPAPKSAKS